MQLEVVRAATALLQDSLPLLAAVRALADLSRALEVDVDDPDFSLFVAVDSETDHLPGADARTASSSSWLTQCDRELAEVERVHGPAVRAAAERLLLRYATAV
ncbi:DUF2489 domain-containing protein [uncultured Methylibium sp.]|uniref:DUF2489 domain-containing protein n=1 Tax=uncultured Methylibium sp. TaxID=381093 RepID=UPI0025DE3A1F|nr:DUF2489 domain-containing protein [uncultured Methylibium sp.]